MGFSMEAWVYGVEVGGCLWGGVWFFWWLHYYVGLRLGFREVGVEVYVVMVLGLQGALSYESFGGFRVEV